MIVLTLHLMVIQLQPMIIPLLMTTHPPTVIPLQIILMSINTKPSILLQQPTSTTPYPMEAQSQWLGIVGTLSVRGL